VNLTLFADLGVVPIADGRLWIQIRSAIGMSSDALDDIIFMFFGNGGVEPGGLLKSLP
jgi:hypothetical protein